MIARITLLFVVLMLCCLSISLSAVLKKPFPLDDYTATGTIA